MTEYQKIESLNLADRRASTLFDKELTEFTRAIRDAGESISWIAAVERFAEHKGLTMVRGRVPGRIGYRGEKVHSLSVVAVRDAEGRDFLQTCYSTCGSQRWSSGGRSGLALLAAGTPCTCLKCGA